MKLTKNIPIVAYVAYGPFGIDYLKRFISAYTKFNSGEKHEILICFKGFSNYEEIKKFKKIINFEFIEFFEKNEKNDYDIGSYFRIADAYKDRLILFLDTHTRMNCNNWLRIFLENYSEKRLIGATGSFASISSQFLRLYYSQYSKFQQIRWGLNHLKKFKLFPNPHLRTTAFLIKGLDLMQLNFDKTKFIKKIETNYFESGRKSLTIQLQNKGFEIGIVNSDNKFFDIRTWRQSDTYCLGEQSKLIFVDNRTDEYKNASKEQKIKMNSLFWGKD
tara:strand:+ start:388 stop:1212 length:825 start_codon:yes stop_codon:yes gene_type:complete